MKNKRTLSVFSLVMINVVAIDSLRNLPINAAYGYSIIFFYIICAIGFLIPCALVTAELATQWPKTGGTYVWVREAFGPKYGFLNIWMQWIYNVVWYPTILSFIGATIASLINPAIIHDRYYMMGIIISCFLLATYANCRGMRLSSFVSEAGAILGTIVPMLLIIILGFTTFFLHQHRTLAYFSFLPDLSDWHNISFLVVVMFSLIGIEMSSVHAEEVKNPEKDYPKALLISSIIILVSLIFASVAIAIAVPNNTLNIVDGLNQAFYAFFKQYHLGWFFPIVEVLIIIGGFAGISTWVIGPTKGLLIAAQDGSMPKKFAQTNKKGAPVNILVLQAVVVIVLSLTFLVFPSVEGAYWFLSDLTVQLAVIYYLTIFFAAIRLRYKFPDRNKNAFKIPGGNRGMIITAGLGIFSCLFGLLIGFIPPEKIMVGSRVFYVLALIAGIVIFSLPPLIIYKLNKKTPP